MNKEETVQFDRRELPSAPTKSVDVVVVSYNSRPTLRRCVEQLAETPGVTLFVADNASTDGSIKVVADLEIVLLARDKNLGFASGCNHAWRAGAAPYVLFLNPDARLDRESLCTLVETAERESGIGVVAPRILAADGSLEFSQRRFPALRSTFAQALFLQRVLPRSKWTDEVVRDPGAYEIQGSPDWVSGACMLVRRRALEAIGGWDETFFLYSEDTDLCRRVRIAGFEIRYVPTATAVHIGGQSSPRANLLPLLAESRIRYVEKHESRPVALLHRMGVALSALSHLLVARQHNVRVGHARALRTALRI